MSGSRSVRALVATLTLYAVGRTLVIHWPTLFPGSPPPADARRVAVDRLPTVMASADVATVTHASGRRGMYASVTPSFPPHRATTRTIAPSFVAPPLDQSPPDHPVPPGSAPGSRATTPRPESPIAAPTLLAAPAGDTRRWSGFAYLFHRRGSGTAGPLAPAGQLGGSQAAVRLAYRVDDAGRFAIAARVSGALDSPAQVEAAAGIDWLPVAGAPLRISVERRVGVVEGGRDAWSLYAAGGVFRTLAPRVELDGYGQAGVVGTRRRDLFADGAVRLVHRTTLSPGIDLRLGGGAWGAAQPGLARLDLGPRAALTVPVADRAVTLALEGRLRVAGNARPGDGVALTLATDF